jgi:hypothetical protein
MLAGAPQAIARMGIGVICETQALQAAVIPAKAGIQTLGNALFTHWIPAFAGMTGVS